MTLACEDGNSKLVVTVVGVDDEDGVGNSLLQIWKLRNGHIGTRFGQDFKIEVQARFCSVFCC